MFGKMLRAVFLLMALGFSAFAEDAALIKPTDFWRVLPYSTNNPAEPAANWRSVDYDDSSWTNLQASFVTTHPTYTGGSEQTVLPQDTVTYCFRKTFQVIDPSFVKWLTLRIDYESGFVAYLNGVEVARRSFPTNATEIPLGSPANPHPRGPTELIDISGGITNLQAGTNVLAIQLHSAGDALPSLLMVPQLLANFTRGPFVQNMTSNSVQIIWQTQLPTDGSLVYGKDTNDVAIASDETTGTNHVITLVNLDPGEKYVYQISSSIDSTVATDDWGNFQTLKMAGSPISFLVVGDTGEATTPQYKIAAQMERQSADLLVHVGDIVYYCFEIEHVDARCFSIYRDQMRSMPYFFCLGNHDSYCLRRQDYYSVFYLPTNSVSGLENYYSFDHGDAHFIMLDTDTQAGQRYDPGSPQLLWLEADLAATKQPWKFIFFHHVIRSSSIHSYDDYLIDGVYDKLQLQAYIGGLASRYGAQIIFNGHDHGYERFAGFEGYNSMVTAGGGARLYGQYLREEGSAQYYTRYNFLRVTLNDPEVAIEAVDDDGIVFDRFYRSRAGSGPGPFQSMWGSPTVEASAGSDLAGNIPGQTFNFSDTNALRTFAGQQANLGHVHVRNDQNFVYVGFENVSIWTNQAVALFLENPNQPGVSDLASLGNGALDDANGEGADGLDLLTNLTFVNFHPSIACLLGDEQADSTLRNFKRAGMRWAVGQGVFHLDQNFSSVPGVRIQQFNRSPQTPVPQFYDENADFIEVAIPLSELGNPQTAGNLGQVRLGAVVMSDPYAGPMVPQLDTAFAGNALTSTADGGFALEPTIIQLAPDPNPFHDAFGFTATVLSDMQLHFEWNSTLGATYTIQSSPALGQPFEDINTPGLPLTGTGAKAVFDLPIDGSSPRFYRLRTN